MQPPRPRTPGLFRATGAALVFLGLGVAGASRLAAAAPETQIQYLSGTGKDDTSRLIADLTGRLDTALRAYALLRDEDARLKRGSPVRPATALAAQVLQQAVPTPTPTPTPRTYVVVDGDTLTRISVKYYGTSSHWNAIYEANRETMRDPGSLSIGMTLIIP